MNIECILRRPGGTKADIDGIEYHFAPLDDGAHVADVEHAPHIDRFLSISDAYKVYHGALEAQTKPVALAVAAPAPVSPVPEASPDTLGLTGSDVHPPQFDIGGTVYTLGDVVRKAFKDSGLSFEGWNDMHHDDRHARIDMALDDLAEAAEKAVETKVYTDGTTATGTAPLPDQSPAQQEAAAAPPAPEPKTRDEWAAAHLAKFGKLPHHKASIDTIKQAIAKG